MKVPIELIRDLREKTGAGVTDCKEALAEAGGDMARAIELLRSKGLKIAAKKAGRLVTEGLVVSYIHGGGRIGVLLELNCETDFVARTERFASLAKDLAMQVAASSPTYVDREEVLEKARQGSGFMREGGLEKGSGQMEDEIEEFLSQACLMEQPFIKNPQVTVGEVVKEAIAAFGENIVVRRFCRFQLGEGLTKS